MDVLHPGANITFNSWDQNPWDIVFRLDRMGWFMGYIGLISFANICYALYRIFLWWRSDNFDYHSIGFICLSLELLNNILILLKSLIYPIYNVHILPYADILLTPQLAVTVISSILVVFFWLDLTTDLFYHGNFLGMMRKPAMTLIGCIVIMEIITNTVRCLVDVDSATILSATYAVLHIGIAVFYFVAAKRILSDEVFSEKKKLITVTKKVVYSASATMLRACCFLVILSPAGNLPLGLTVVVGILYTSYFLQSLMLLWIFNPPNSNSSKTKSSSSAPELQNE